MEEEESNNDDYREYLRKNLTDLFGTFEEFNERINMQGIRNGISRARLRGKTSPYLNNVSSGSPNHLPVKTCLESMRNLVDEPLSSLPPRLGTLRNEQRLQTYHHHSNTASSSSSFAIDDRIVRKRRDREEERESEQQNQFENADSERHRKHSRFESETTQQQIIKKVGNNTDPPSVIRREEKDGMSSGLSPDSGVHSTENDIGDDNENHTTEDILNIMTGMSEPKLSPIPSNLLSKYQQLEKEKEQEKARKRKREEDKKKTKKDQEENEHNQNRKERKKSFSNVFNDASSSDSSAVPSVVSSRQSSVSPSPPPPISRVKEESSAVISIPVPRLKNGELKLNGLKSEKLHKLFKLAKQNGRLIETKTKENGRDEKRRKEEDRKRRKEKEEKEKNQWEKEKKDRSGREESEKKANSLTIPLAANRKVQQVKAMTPEIAPIPSKASTTGTPSMRPPSANSAVGGQLTPRSSKNTPPGPPSSQATNSRPSSSMSISAEVSTNNLFSSAISHTSTNRSQNATPRQERPDSRASSSAKMMSPLSGGSTSTTCSSTTSTFRCSWVHTRLTSAQRVAVPDLTGPNPKSKIDFYHDLAKEFKSEADINKDRILKVLGYMNSTVYFIMEALAKYDKDRTVKGCNLTSSIYKDIHKLLRSTVGHAMRETSDPHFMHMLPRIKILTQAVLSIILYHTYLLKSEQSLRNIPHLDSREFNDAITNTPSSSSVSTPSATNKLLANASSNTTSNTPTNPNSANSTPKSNQSHLASLISNCNTVTTMPTVLYDIMRQQIRQTNLLVLAQRYWQDSRTLAAQVDPEFVKGIESVCGKSLSMDSSFETMAPIVLTAVASLKAEYEKEKTNSVKPVVNKVKATFEAARKLGGFYAISEPQNVQTSQNIQKSRQHTLSSGSLPPPPPSS